MARTLDEKKVQSMKNKIIDTSIQIILEKGFTKFTLATVATNLGVTKATIYWYFPSKDDLINNISKRIWSSEVEALQILEKQNTSAKEKLEALLLRKNEIHSCVLPIKLLLEFYSEENETKTKIQEGYTIFQKVLSNILLQGKQNKEFSFTFPEDELAKIMISTLDGLAINNYTLGNDYQPVSQQNLLHLWHMLLGIAEENK